MPEKLPCLLGARIRMEIWNLDCFFRTDCFLKNHVLSAHAEYLVKFSNHVETVSSFYLCFSVPRLIVC